MVTDRGVRATLMANIRTDFANESHLDQFLHVE